MSPDLANHSAYNELDFGSNPCFSVASFVNAFTSLISLRKSICKRIYKRNWIIISVVNWLKLHNNFIFVPVELWYYDSHNNLIGYSTNGFFDNVILGGVRYLMDWLRYFDLTLILICWINSVEFDLNLNLNLIWFCSIVVVWLSF